MWYNIIVVEIDGVIGENLVSLVSSKTVYVRVKSVKTAEGALKVVKESIGIGFL